MTEAELTILSLLAETPRYGHDIQRVIDERGLREWLTIGFSSIQYILNKLEKQDMIAAELRANGQGPARKIYRLTEAGRGVLQTAVADLLREPHALGSGFELGLALLHVLKPAQVYRVLSAHRTDLSLQVDAVRRSFAQHKDTGAHAHHIRALYTHSIAVMKAELQWLADFLADWRERYPAATTNRHSAADDDTAQTPLHRRTTPGTAQLIQRLQSNPPDTSPDETDTDGS